MLLVWPRDLEQVQKKQGYVWNRHRKGDVRPFTSLLRSCSEVELLWPRLTWPGSVWCVQISSTCTPIQTYHHTPLPYPQVNVWRQCAISLSLPLLLCEAMVGLLPIAVHSTFHLPIQEERMENIGEHIGTDLARPEHTENTPQSTASPATPLVSNCYQVFVNNHFGDLFPG